MLMGIIYYIIIKRYKSLQFNGQLMSQVIFTIIRNNFGLLKLVNYKQQAIPLFLNAVSSFTCAKNKAFAGEITFYFDGVNQNCGYKYINIKKYMRYFTTIKLTII